ncbi:MBL fold metallo-hydrolase [Nocardia bovistercoris]|uniref:MBL fold metallo-hydrolase n=1 Tax=Nocardia bovistercoris TaxID=2785916 RepID=A0A931I785_9NOCA|nr:MBL fold metallo-hydrolase [Nocardia bovistercoris]MBH0774700.1 MBL fold metallo-hydrolase [Nocardia bovistercoris]
MEINHIGREISVLADFQEVPGIGFIPVNAFVLHAAEPVVIDTGLSLPERGFMDALGSVLDPRDVEWIWITHPDRDHTGALRELLDAAPRARLITTFLGMGIMSMEAPLPMNRVYLLNPGQSLDVGDRRLTAFRPPLFDNPSTTGCYDEHTGACFSSDCFGAPMPSAELAGCPDVGYVDKCELRDRQLLWATVDSPWIHTVDYAKYLETFDVLRSFDPALVLGTHLPPAIGRMPEFLDMLAAAPGAVPFTGPDQAAVELLLATFEAAPPTD